MKENEFLSLSQGVAERAHLRERCKSPLGDPINLRGNDANHCSLFFERRNIFSLTAAKPLVKLKSASILRTSGVRLWASRVWGKPYSLLSINFSITFFNLFSISSVISLLSFISSSKSGCKSFTYSKKFASIFWISSGWNLSK